VNLLDRTNSPPALADPPAGSRSPFPLLVASLLMIAPGPACFAADFSHAQKIFVPASRIDRRVDFTSLQGREAAPAASPDNQTPGDAGVNYPAPSKAGLVPPPPPVPPTSTKSTLVPPPPPSPPILPGSPAAPPATGSLKAIAAPASAEQARKKAAELVRQGKLEEADQVLRGAYKSAPRNTLVVRDLLNLSVMRGRKLLAAGELDAAGKAAREALYVDASSTVAADLLNQILTRQGINPKDPAARLRLADHFVTDGKDAAAGVEYRAALKLKASAAGHVGLGDIAARAGNKQKARQEYQLALEVDANSGAAHRQMGLLRQSMGDVVGANADLSRAVIIDRQDKAAGSALVELWQKQVSALPNDANSHMGLARAYQLTGNLSAAQAEYRQVVRIDPNHPNLPAARQSFKLALARQEAERDVAAARTLEAQGAIPEANQKVCEALGLCPTDAGYRLYQGYLLERMGQYAQAHDAYLSVLKDDPKNVQAAQRLQALPTGWRPPPAAPAQGLAAPPAGLLAPAAGAGGLAPAAGPLLPAAGGLTAAAGAVGSAAGALAPFVEAPPALTLPASPQAAPDAVSNLSGFLTGLRNTAIKNQLAFQEYESQVHKSLTGRGSYYGANGKLADVPITPEDVLTGRGTGSSSSNFVSRAVADLNFGENVPSPGGSAASAAAEAAGSAPSSGGIAGVLDRINRDLARTQNLSGTGGAAAGATAAAAGLPVLSAAAAGAGDTAGEGAARPAPAAAPPAVATPAMDPAAYQRLLYAEQQNKLLAEKLQQAQQTISRLQQNNAPSLPAGDIDSIAPVSPPPPGKPLVPSAADEPAVDPTPVPLPPAAAGGGAPGQSLPPAGSLDPAAGSLGPPVQLKLEGVTPAGHGLQLKVVLSNDQDVSLPVSREMDAVIRTGGQPDMRAKVSFQKKVVPPHRQIHGLIKLQTKHIAPTADLFVPNLLPSGFAQRDVHLTASAL